MEWARLGFFLVSHLGFCTHNVELQFVLDFFAFVFYPFKIWVGNTPQTRHPKSFFQPSGQVIVIVLQLITVML